MAAAAVTPAPEEQEEEDAGVSTSTDDDVVANTKRAGARQTIGMPDAAAVLAGVSLSCKTEPMEGGEGRGTVEARRVRRCFSWIYLQCGHSRKNKTLLIVTPRFALVVWSFEE